MADQDLKITASLQDLISGPLGKIQTQLDALQKEIVEADKRTKALEATEQAVTKAIKEQTSAVLGATQASQASVQATRAQADATRKAGEASRKAAADQRELASAAGDVARGLGISVGPLQSIVAAAGPIAALAASAVALSEAIGAVATKAKAIEEAFKPSRGRIGGGALDQLRQDVLELSSSTGLAAEEVAAGVNSIFQNTTARTRASVNELLTQSALLAKAGFGTVADSARGLDGVLSALNLRVQDSAKAAAVLATSSDRAGVPIAQFAQSLEAAGPLARAFGLSLEDLSALLVSIKAQGVSLADATRSIGGLLAIVTDEGNTTRKELEKLGVNFKGATRDGEGFAGVLQQIAAQTQGQPELLNKLFPGGALQLTRVFAAIQGASQGFREELTRTSRAAEDFAVINQRAAENARSYWAKAFNEISNSAVAVFNDASDAWAVIFAGLGGDISQARAEYAALLQSVSQSGIEVEFFKARGVSEQAARFVREVEAAIEAQDPEAVVRVVSDLSGFADSVDQAVQSLVGQVADQVGKLGLGQSATIAVGGSPLAKLLQLNAADQKLLEGQLQTVFENLRAQANKAGQQIDRAALAKALTESIERAIPAINRLPESLGKAVAATNERLAGLGGAFDGQAARLEVQGDRVALVFEEIGKAAQGAQRSSVDALGSIAVELTKIAAAQANAQSILEATLPAREREVIGIERQIESIRETIKQYQAEGLAADALERALSNLIAKRKELQGISAKVEAQGPSVFTQFLEGAARIASEAAAQTAAIEFQAKAQLSIDAANLAQVREETEAAQAQLLQDAQAVADSREDVLRLVLTPEIQFRGEQLNAQVLDALEPVAAKLRDLQAQFDAGKISADQFRTSLALIREEGQQVRDSIAGDGDFFGAFTARLEELRIQLTDTSLQGREFADDLVGGIGSAFDTLIDKLIQGEAGLKDFGRAVALEVGKAIAKLLALKATAALLNLFGFSGGGGGAGSGFDTGTGIPFSPPAGTPGVLALGGVVPGRIQQVKQLDSASASHWNKVGAALKAGAPVQAYAQGGVASRPQVAVFGEGGGAEAFVPLPGPNRGIPVEFKREPVMASRGETQRAQQNTVNITLTVASLDPRTAADVVLAQMPKIQQAIAGALNSGADRGLLSAVRGSVR